MDRLISILRAAHCRSTHQFFVVDAIPLVATDSGRRLGSQLLRHHQAYLRGAKAPDKEFRDFRNHVLHVDDKHWGGAPKLAQEWYANFVRKIRQQRWKEAAYCGGVLSHYFTDPIMPLHTAQSPEESVVHRPLEWSVTKSYERILRHYRGSGQQVVFDLTDEAGWLADAVTRSAELAHAHYGELIQRYDLANGCKRPETGLDEHLIDVLSGLFGVAITGWARIIERAAEQATSQIPRSALSLASLVATFKMPVGWILRRIESKAEQQAVRAIFAEYAETGTVVKNLPLEVKSVAHERKRDLMIERDKTRLKTFQQGHAAARQSTVGVKPGKTDEQSSEHRDTNSVIVGDENRRPAVQTSNHFRLADLNSATVYLA